MWRLEKMRKLTTPRTSLIERVAGEFAGTWYEVGKAQGLTSKYKTARQFARANVERFVPNAVSHLLDMLNDPTYNEHVKQEIYTAIMERVHDPDTNLMQDNRLPDIDISKYLDHKPEASIIIDTRRKSDYEIMRK